MLLRVVNSPFGRVLQAIRENPFRAEALGYRIVFHRTLATCLAAALAAAAGALNAIWLRYVGPDTALSFSIQIDVLVIVVIGGMGTLYGAILGAALFVIAENYLQALIGRLSQGAGDLGLPLARAGAASRPLADVARPDVHPRRLFRADWTLRQAETGRLNWHLVKAFNSVGAGQMVNPPFAGGRPTVFVCGNNAAASSTATKICDQLGWDSGDMGPAEAAGD